MHLAAEIVESERERAAKSVGLTDAILPMRGQETRGMQIGFEESISPAAQSAVAIERFMMIAKRKH